MPQKHINPDQPNLFPDEDNSEESLESTSATPGSLPARPEKPSRPVDDDKDRGDDYYTRW